MGRYSKQYSSIYPVIIVMLVIVMLVSMRYGAVDLSLDEMYSGMQHMFVPADQTPLAERIFMEIRLPRAILCAIVGAGLAVGGALMQALFRNPIVEPGLVGTSSGAAFGASLYFVIGAAFKYNGGEWTLPLAACAGGIISTALVFVLSQSKHDGKSSIVGLLLTGIAINALFLSGVGFLAYTARDSQARSITFWTLGTLSGANWHSVLIVGISTLLCIAVALRYTKHLNALMIGEEEAQYMGINIRKLKLRILLVNVVMVAISTSFTGVIGFVGLIVPHFLRMLKGSDNRFLIIGSALMGALVLSVADIAARMLLRPAELPLGVVTSIIGVPVFIILLRKKNYYF